MSYSSDDGLSKFISDQYVLCFKMSEAKKCLLKQNENIYFSFSIRTE
jgi:hypothetical protein